MSGKKWVKIFLLLLIFVSGFAGMVNYIVDPYGLKSNKNKFDENLMTINKANITKLKINLQADYYLIGTSRVKRVNPNLIEKYLPNKKVYNINISAATFRENSMLANKVINNGSNIIYGFDAFSLNKNRFSEDKILNRYKTFKKEIESQTVIPYFLSIDSFIMSCKDIIKRLVGINTEQYALSENSKDCNASLSEIRKALDLSVQEEKSSYTNFETVSKKDIIQLAKKATRNDIFIIYPKHFYYYTLFQKHQNIEEKYFASIKTLVKNTEAKVWNFYQINSITTSEKNFDKNGWHFKPKIADLIFAKIFNDKSIMIPDNFGVLLTKNNIDEYLETLKEQIKNYDLNQTLLK